MSDISEKERDKTSDISDPPRTGLACRGAGFNMRFVFRGVKMSHVSDMKSTGLSGTSYRSHDKHTAAITHTHLACP